MESFKMSAALWKWTAVVGGMVSLALLVVTGVIGQTASDDGGNVLIAIVLGLAIGALLRAGMKRGWAEIVSDAGKPLVLSRPLRIGAAWRAVVLFFAGMFLINLLDQAAWSDASETILMLAALLAITEASLLMGLRYGARIAAPR